MPRPQTGVGRQRFENGLNVLELFKRFRNIAVEFQQVPMFAISVVRVNGLEILVCWLVLVEGGRQGGWEGGGVGSERERELAMSGCMYF